MASKEEKVEEYFKKILDRYNIRHFGKTETMDPEIKHALDSAESKSGGSGSNYPDIQVMLIDDHRRRIPMMIEAKGQKNALEKLDTDGNIILESKKGKISSAVQLYAVNGALHYGNAILNWSSFEEVIIVGINGTQLDNITGELLDPECKAYYVAKRNSKTPKLIENFNLVQCKKENVPALFRIFDEMLLTDAEREMIKLKTEKTLEEKIKRIHQSIYENKRTSMLTTNQKLYLFCGLIMAGLPISQMSDLHPADLRSDNNSRENDGTKLLTRINTFLDSRESTADKVTMINNMFSDTFHNPGLWKPNESEPSVLYSLYKQIKEEIIPLFNNGVNLDFTGKILNSLNDWADIEGDRQHDVVLTPRYITNMMAIMARTDRNSLVWDNAMGSAGFLVSAMDIMIKDAQKHIQDKFELDSKIENIKHNQLLGMEILRPVYVLAVLNMILMGDGSSNIYQGDAHSVEMISKARNFPATVYLLNPPYSSPGKGFIFAEEAFNIMINGYACILIQENAGSGKGLPYTKKILKKNTLMASIHMPSDLFAGKSSVQTAIYVFKVAVPHDPEQLVTFIDMSEDGYIRQNRRKSTQEVNLRDKDHAKERYEEVEAIVLGKRKKTNYYSEENEKLIKDVISLDGNDWTFNQHKKINIAPTENDFKKTVIDFLEWQVSNVLSKKGNL